MNTYFQNLGPEKFRPIKNERLRETWTCTDTTMHGREQPRMLLTDFFVIQPVGGQETLMSLAAGGFEEEL